MIVSPFVKIGLDLIENCIHGFGNPHKLADIGLGGFPVLFALKALHDEALCANTQDNRMSKPDIEDRKPPKRLIESVLYVFILLLKEYRIHMLFSFLDVLLAGNDHSGLQRRD